MKTVRGIAFYNVNNKNIVMVSDEYGGAPVLMYEYDILMCSDMVYNKYKDDLIANHLLKKGWNPTIIKI